MNEREKESVVTAGVIMEAVKFQQLLRVSTK